MSTLKLLTFITVILALSIGMVASFSYQQTFRFGKLIIGLCLFIGGATIFLYIKANSELAEKKRLEETLQRRNEYMTSLHEISLSIFKRQRLEELLSAIITRAASLTKVEHAFLFLYSAEADLLRMFVGIGLFHDQIGLELKPGQGLSGNVFLSGQPLVSNDYATWPERLRNQAFDQIQSIMGIPLKRDSFVTGVIGLANTRVNRPFGAEEVNIIQLFAEIASVAVANSRLDDQLQAELKIRQQTEKELARLNEELKRLATLDGLTQVANRRQFDTYIEQEWRRLQRERNFLSLIMCDVDDFKAYNDHYGHLAGDECLRAVAQALRQNSRRAGDLVARYGGEEFVIILPNTPPQGAVHVAEVIRQAIERLQIPHEKSRAHRCVTISCGVASMIPERQDNLEMLIKATDIALYEAKSAGRNQVCLQNPLTLRGGLDWQADNIKRPTCPDS
jgi:diguanylate cyclase (GGDEF)-like protein